MKTAAQYNPNPQSKNINLKIEIEYRLYCILVQPGKYGMNNTPGKHRADFYSKVELQYKLKLKVQIEN